MGHSLSQHTQHHEDLLLSLLSLWPCRPTPSRTSSPVPRSTTPPSSTPSTSTCCLTHWSSRRERKSRSTLTPLSSQSCQQEPRSMSSWSRRVSQSHASQSQEFQSRLALAAMMFRLCWTLFPLTCAANSLQKERTASCPRWLASTAIRTPTAPPSSTSLTTSQPSLRPSSTETSRLKPRPATLPARRSFALRTPFPSQPTKPSLQLERTLQ